MKIRELRKEELPRERAMREGISALSNRELLALLLKSGYEGVSVLEVADALLSRYSLREMSNLDYATLCKEKGIKKAKSLELLACFELSKRLMLEESKEKEVFDSYGTLVEWLKREIGSERNEIFLVLFLDASRRLLSYRRMFAGSESAAAISLTEIYREALLQGAKGILCVHNHPMGSLTPSDEDIKTTKELIRAGKTMKIPLLDHLIISEEGYYSIKKHLEGKGLSDVLWRL